MTMRPTPLTKGDARLNERAASRLNERAATNERAAAAPSNGHAALSLSVESAR